MGSVIIKMWIDGRPVTTKYANGRKADEVYASAIKFAVLTKQTQPIMWFLNDNDIMMYAGEEWFKVDRLPKLVGKVVIDDTPEEQYDEIPSECRAGSEYNVFDTDERREYNDDQRYGDDKRYDDDMGPDEMSGEDW